MTKTKNRLKFLSIMVAVVFLAVSLLSIAIRSTTVSDLQTRTIDVNEIGTLSYEEKVNQLLEDFDVYSYDYADNTITFNGEFTRDLTDFLNYQQLSTIDNTPITKAYSTRFNCKEEVFTLITTYSQNGIVINQTSDSVVPFYDEALNDYFITLEDGSKISVSESLELDNMENCVAIVAAVPLAIVAAALAVTIVVAAPTIVQVVETVVTTVVSWVRSFWSWFCSLWKPVTKTVTTTSVTTVATPALTIDRTTYKTKAVTKDDIKTRFGNSLYYLAFADPTNGYMYFSVVPITQAQAIAILNSAVYVPCIGNPNKQMIASTYTFYQASALAVAQVVGLNSRTPANFPENHGNGKPGYFWHYHTIPAAPHDHSPHSFFGLPI